MAERFLQRADGASDEFLLSAMALGDERAGVAFVRRYQRRVFGLAVGMLADPALAEDVAQEAFVRIWRHAETYDARRGSVTTWVLTITRRLAIDSLRVRRAVPTDRDALVWLELASDAPPPDEVAVASDVATRAKGALSTLPIEQRRAVVLATLYGRTASEIARSEQIPLGTAKSRVRLGIAKLRTLATVEGQR